MKVCTPGIAWHDRQRVSAIDFQPGHDGGEEEGLVRLATAGHDNHVVVSGSCDLSLSVNLLLTLGLFVQIWRLSHDSEGKSVLHPLSDLDRHTNAVECIRWSRDGTLLASGSTGIY